jgi:hypothetical protein
MRSLVWRWIVALLLGTGWGLAVSPRTPPSAGAGASEAGAAVETRPAAPVSTPSPATRKL